MENTAFFYDLCLSLGVLKITKLKIFRNIFSVTYMKIVNFGKTFWKVKVLLLFRASFLCHMLRRVYFSDSTCNLKV